MPRTHRPLHPRQIVKLAMAGTVAAPVLLVLVVGAVQGWSAQDCDELPAGPEALRALPVFGTAPEGARPTGAVPPSVECFEDEGDAWLEGAADYTYAPGTAPRVTEFYQQSLMASGWRPYAYDRVGEACWTRDTAAGPTQLCVSTATYDVSPGTYRVTVTTGY